MAAGRLTCLRLWLGQCPGYRKYLLFGKSWIEFLCWLYEITNGDPTVHPHVGKGNDYWMADWLAIFRFLLLKFQHLLVLFGTIIPAQKKSYSIKY